MISLLKGTLELRDDPYLIIDVNGVGYKVLASQNVLSHATKIGETVKVYTYTLVREDALELFGFSSPQDLKLFELLISVSGVGPKTAISIFSFGTHSEIMNAISMNNVDFFTSVPRLGKKNAQKIIIELKSKIGSTGDLDLETVVGREHEDVLSALRTFGFSTKEALEAVKAVNGEAKTAEEKIRLALKYLGK